MKSRSWALLAFLLLLVAFLVGVTLEGVTFQEGADEGYYLMYAIRVAEEGPSVFPRLFQEYLGDTPDRQFFPSPIRLTTVGLGALAVRIAGPHFRSLQLLSLAAFLLLLVLVFLQITRTMGEEIAFWTTFLLGFSPLHLGMARRALSDSLVATLTIASLLFFLHALKAGKKIGWGWVSLLYLITFLARESTVILVPISLLLLLWYGIQGNRVGGFSFLAVSVIPFSGAVLLLSLAAGGFSVALKTLETTIASVSMNPYALRYGSGPWFRYVVDSLLLSPWTSLFYLIWVGYLLGTHEKDPISTFWASLPVFFIAFTACTTKNIRYLLVLETPIRLGTVDLLRRLAFRQDRFRRWKLAIPILLLAWVDLTVFLDLFLQAGLYDPVSFPLLKLRKFIP